jgi:hypothetical protein
MCEGGLKHIFGKLLTKATTLFHTLPQSEVCTRNYGPPNCWESQLQEFQDPNLGVPGQKDIWM